jgi:hypothetical protein
MRLLVMLMTSTRSLGDGSPIEGKTEARERRYYDQWMLLERKPPLTLLGEEHSKEGIHLTKMNTTM